MAKSKRSLFVDFKDLYQHISTKRKRQLFFILVFMLIGAISELATLGAVLPFLSLIADPDQISNFPLFQSLLMRLGWVNFDQIIVPAIMIFSFVVIFTAIIRLTLTWVSQKFIFGLGYDLSVNVYERSLYQPYSYHASKNSSELVAGIYKVQVTTMCMLLPLMQAIIASVIAIVILCALIFIDINIALFAFLGFGLIYISISYATRKKLQSNSEIIADSQEKRIQAVQEGLGGIRDVLIDQAQPAYLHKFKRLDMKFRDAQAMNVFIGMAPRYVIEASGIVLIAAIAVVLSGREGGLALALPLLGSLAIGAQKVLPLLQIIYSSFAQISGHKQELVDVLDILDLPLPSQNDKYVSKNRMPFKDAIEFHNVSYRYDTGDKPVLNSINLSIKRGACIGVIGKTGSGKSTIVDLAMGLLEPSKGEVKVDGILLTKENVLDWQSQVAHVAQSVYLADTSIAENIAFGVNPELINWNRLNEAMVRAQISEYIESLPDGYNTKVGERGVRLSGGQRQRIGIARALYKQASVLVFDEATSALDTKTELAVMNAIQSLGSSVTVIIIAHRLSTVEFCNQVFQVEAGKILN